MSVFTVALLYTSRAWPTKQAEVLGHSQDPAITFSCPSFTAFCVKLEYRISQYSCREDVPRFIQPYPDLLSMMLTSLSLAETETRTEHKHWAQLVLSLSSEWYVNSAYLIVSARSHNNKREQKGLILSDSIPSLILQPASHVGAKLKWPKHTDDLTQWGQVTVIGLESLIFFKRAHGKLVLTH